jgi:hypothetical protein
LGRCAPHGVMGLPRGARPLALEIGDLSSVTAIRAGTTPSSVSSRGEPARVRSARRRPVWCRALTPRDAGSWRAPAVSTLTASGPDGITHRDVFSRRRAWASGRPAGRHSNWRPPGLAAQLVAPGLPERLNARFPKSTDSCARAADGAAWSAPRLRERGARPSSGVGTHGRRPSPRCRSWLTVPPPALDGVDRRRLGYGQGGDGS